MRAKKWDDKIASQIYNLIIAQKKIKGVEEERFFKKMLQEKIAAGLAAKCFL